MNEHTVLSPCFPILDFSGIVLAHIHLQSIGPRTTCCTVCWSLASIYTFSRIGFPQLATSFVHASASISNMSGFGIFSSLRHLACFSFNLLFCLLLSFRLQRTLSAVSVPAQLVASFVDAPASFSNIAYFGIISTLRHSACFSPTHFRCCCMRILGLALSFGQQRTLSAVSFLAQPAIVCWRIGVYLRFCIFSSLKHLALFSSFCLQSTLSAASDLANVFIVC